MIGRNEGNAPAWTPGPWTRCDGMGERYTLRADNGETLIATAYFPRGRKNATDERKANARLIAAAPELYEALDELARMADQWSGQIEPPPPALDRAWRVLAKARDDHD
jgi:glycine/D-amino acid oxidase-like deaminating enzyme